MKLEHDEEKLFIAPEKHQYRWKIWLCILTGIGWLLYGILLVYKPVLPTDEYQGVGSMAVAAVCFCVAKGLSLRQTVEEQKRQIEALKASLLEQGQKKRM